MLKRIWMLLLSIFVMVTLTPFSVKATDHPLKKGQTIEADGATKNRVMEAYGKLPLYFEANQGQAEGTVRFLSRGSGYGLFLTSTEAILTLTRANQASEKWGRKAANHQTNILRMKWEGANQNPRIEGVDELEGKSHYFIRNDPDQWRINIPLYGKVRYRDLYRGIDLLYYGNQKQLEYDLVVAPKEDPSAIRLAIEGAEEVKVDEGGNLLIRIGDGEIIQHTPRIYQEVEGEKRFIKGAYVVDPLAKNEDKGKVLIGFKIDKFDTGKPLFIDPVLTYSTYFGGSDDEVGNGIAVDSSGNAYITGRTSSTDFPILSFEQRNYAGGYDVFVTKLNSSGSALVYSTYLGGSDDDVGNGIAVDSSGYAYITGYTGSTDFPTAHASQGASGGSYDVFVAKLSPSGSQLVYSTYLGGRCDDEGNGIAVDSSGNAYVTGYTCSTNFPVVTPLQRDYAGGLDVFIAKLDPSGALLYSTYLGGNGDDVGNGIAVDSSGNTYITGYTTSTDFPIKSPMQGTKTGGLDAFVTKVTPSGSALVYSTYVGGSGDDVGNGIAVDSSGNAYITGYTLSTNFPAQIPIQGAKAGGSDAFVTKLNPSGSALVYSTYLGGSGDDVGNGIAVDSSGNAYITGYSLSTNFPTANAIQGTNGGGRDAFVTKLNPSGSTFVYSTYLGGSHDDAGNGIAVDSSGNAYITGYSLSIDFPTASAMQETNAGGVLETSDAFVTKISSETQKPNLTPYQPQGWSDKIVVTNKTGCTNSSCTDSSPLLPTDTLYVDWAITNNGRAATSARFYSDLYVDGASKGPWYFDPPLNPGEYAYVVNFSIGTLGVGTHTLKLVADSTGVIDESNEGDNEYQKVITVQNMNGPDLTGEWVSVSQSCKGSGSRQKCKITATLMVENIGNQDVKASFYVEIYLEGGVEDTLIKRVSVGKIKKAGSKTLKFSYSLPTGANAQGKYIYALIDADDTVDEVNENNNQIFYDNIQ